MRCIECGSKAVQNPYYKPEPELDPSLTKYECVVNPTHVFYLTPRWYVTKVEDTTTESPSNRPELPEDPGDPGEVPEIV